MQLQWFQNLDASFHVYEMDGNGPVVEEERGPISELNTKIIFRFLTLGVKSSGSTINELTTISEPNQYEGLTNGLLLGGELKPAEAKKMFTDVKCVTEEHEWNGLLKIKNGRRWCDEYDVGFGHQSMRLTSDNTFVLVFHAQLSFFQCHSYPPPNVVHSLNFDHFVGLSWEHVNYFSQLHSVLSYSMVGLVKLLFIFKIVRYLVDVFDAWRIVGQTELLLIKQVDRPLTFEDVHYLDKSMVVLLLRLLVVVATDYSKIEDEFLRKTVMSHAVLKLRAGGIIFVTLRMQSYGDTNDVSGCKCGSLLFGSKTDAAVLDYPCGDHWFKICGATIATHRIGSRTNFSGEQSESFIQICLLDYSNWFFELEFSSFGSLHKNMLTGVKRHLIACNIISKFSVLVALDLECMRFKMIYHFCLQVQNS
ncbi:hypothetical protein K7X08_020450 [Anisodus acutangulus]|uniref:Uncharacterized protein n=1 Tax=Anisodus acutangulus TaxID=402998 RepID=A0A9Q1REI9_9SOLA|nr:hypothetical protein K7X08_020450 [Anisodus acutangulus]